MAKRVKLIIIGAGGRGTGYSVFAKENPDRAEIVAVAEPRDFQRNNVGDGHNIPEERRFRCWSEVAKLPKFADAVLICTQDHMHEEPAIAFARLGYHIMLEKPMAPTPEACRNIVAEVKKAGVLFAVCHVLRYTMYTRKLKELLNSGAIGDIVSLQHLEPVQSWHQAHSFVRGNWRNEEESSFMLLAKCCHDIDWISYIMNARCNETQSFGFLKYFKRENQPKGAADRCVDCPSEIESNCPYSSLKIYLRDRICKDLKGWPTDVITNDLTEEGVMKALREGPYGRCVFACDNDVVDHQVVNMEFEGERTAAMTMTAFCNEGARQTRIFGTRGSIRTDSQMIYLTDFLTDETTTIDTNLKNDGGILTGHGGGDGGLMDAFIYAVANNDPSAILSGVDETLESHLMVFAAEESRKKNKIVKIKL